MLNAVQIKSARVERGLTQIDVAAAVGVSVVAYRLWEYGGTSPTEDNEKKLRQVLSIGGGKIDNSGKQDTTRQHKA